VQAAFPRRQHARLHRVGILRLAALFDFRDGHGVHFHLQVDAVQKRPADARKVALNLVGLAAAGRVLLPWLPQGQGFMLATSMQRLW
jgi:hypothetical protein